MTHQHTDPEPDGIRLIRLHPAINLPDKYITVFFHHMERQQITGRPVINMRKKTLQFFQTFIIISDLLDQQAMEIIFLIILMRKNLQEHFGSFCFSKFFCKFPEYRCPDTDDLFFLHSRNQPCMKIPISCILHFEQSFPDIPDHLFLIHLSSPPFIPKIAIRELTSRSMG